MDQTPCDPARERHWVFARRLRERRSALGLTQRQVVAKLEQRGPRISNRALSAMENGRGLNLGLLPELAEALDCTITYLLGLTADPSSWQPGEPQFAREPGRAQVMLLGAVGKARVEGGGILTELPAGFAAVRTRGADG
jgi:transcriptional regulator with XRE-family HTH domain